MVILELYINHFGKIRNRRIQLRNGLNVITGDNGSGKSTIAGFILAMLYGLEPDSDEYNKYYPREYSGQFGGQMRVSIGGGTYEIERSFLSDSPSFTVRREPEGELIWTPEEWLRGVLSEVDREQYVASGFLSQHGLTQDIYRHMNETDFSERSQRIESRRKLLEAKKELIARRERFSNQDTSVVDDLQEAKSKLSAKKREYEALFAERERKVKLYKSEREELRRVQKVPNTNVEENLSKLKEDMIKKKNALESLKGILPHEVKEGNGLGTFLCVLGMLIAIVTYFYYCSYGFEEPEKYYVIGGAMIAGILFLTGIIVTLVRIFRRKKEDEFLLERDDLSEEAKIAENRYRDYLNRSGDIKDAIETRNQKESELKDLSMNLEQGGERLNELKEEILQLMKDIEEMERSSQGQRTSSETLLALNLAIDGLEKAGATDRSVFFEQVSAIANDHFGRLWPEEEGRLVAEEDELLVATKTGEFTAAKLSSGAARSAFFAYRMAMVDVMDPRRNLPIILDDPFESFDSERMSVGMQILRTNTRQAIVFSCQNREQKSI